MVVSSDMTGKIAIVTGAAGGFGRAIVKGFIDQGMRVGICDIDADAVAKMERAYGKDRALALVADIADPATCAAQVRKLVDHFGGLHILVNNAALGMGAVRADHFTRTVQIEDIDDAVWQSFMAVNMNGAFFLAKSAMPILRRQGWGRIINVTTSFFTMLRPGFAPYGPAKAALEAWSASLAGTLRGSGITVNVVVPGGPADTAMVPPESGFDRSQLISPERMVPPILWLCSEAGSAVTGARYLAAEWDPASPPTDPAKIAVPAAWPQLGPTAVWPDGHQAPRLDVG